MDEDDELGSYTDLPDEIRAQLEQARTAVDVAVRDYVRILRSADFPDDPPYIQGWVVGCEWTNVTLERGNAGGRDVIAPEGQMLAVGSGLGQYIVNRYA